MIDRKRDPVLSLLHEGKENALSARQLAEILGTSPRAITKKVEGLRQCGAPICASSCGDSGGYYIAVDDCELEAYIARRDRRSKTIAKATTAMRDTLDAMRGQQCLFHQNEKAAPEDGEKNSLVR